MAQIADSTEVSLHDRFAKAEAREKEAVEGRKRLIKRIESKLRIPGEDLIEALEDDGPRIRIANALVGAARKDKASIKNEAMRRGIKLP